MPINSASNGNQHSVDDHGDEKSRRHPRWTRQETLSLIQAKEITESSPNKGRKISSTLLGGSLSSSSLSLENTEPKWVMISTYCNQLGVSRGPAQCRKRWSNLIGDFKKVRAWESKLEDKTDSFWNMRNDLRKENKLPVSFDVEVFKVLEGRETGVVSPLPLQAVPAAVSENVNDQSDDDEKEDEVEENGVKREVLEVEDEILTDINDGEQDKPGFRLDDNNKTDDNVTESPVQNFCTPESVSEEQHHQAFQEQNRNSNQDALRESRPGISNLDSQEKGKRRRLSTGDHKSNCLEEQIIRALEINNKLLNSQLDNHDKNCQLDREQRKENSDVLMTALGKLTDVLSKIADKL
ncbi:trihelix transcription factor ASR3 isoform X2 [Beta vulgaris subsp. vulgaris]|uniref:trihelix transcription factor ASR3 isoform X2 n=1 Tax=Beta vulgaris subsp. vulgaris TaxID=3555 RepID=UPI00203763F6|nr:trihelix transcription factor ASR3 isoform X2 [Beta vulgaris subsp. vulgaris]